MKIATFNINNVSKRLPNLLRWLKRSKPDVVCLQELKCEAKNFPKTELRKAGYSAVWEGQKSWNGVAILCRGNELPIVTASRLPGDPADKEARYIEAAVRGIVIDCIYLPNGNPQPGPKFEYKMKWFTRLARHAARLEKQGHPTILADDFNVAPTDLDMLLVSRADDRRCRCVSAETSASPPVTVEHPRSSFWREPAGSR